MDKVNELYEQKNKLFKVIRADRDEIEDAIQDVALSMSEGKSFDNNYYAVKQQVLLNRRLKSMTKQSKAVIVNIDGQQIKTETTPLDLLLQKRQTLWILDYITSSPAKQGTMFYEKYLNGITYSQISKKYNVSYDNVKSNCNLLMSKIKHQKQHLEFVHHDRHSLDYFTVEQKANMRKKRSRYA